MTSPKKNQIEELTDKLVDVEVLKRRIKELYISNDNYDTLDNKGNVYKIKPGANEFPLRDLCFEVENPPPVGFFDFSFHINKNGDK